MFTPPFWARGAVAQTVIAQLPFRTWGKNEMVERGRDEVVRVSGGVSVHGVHSAIGGPECRGLAILLSGWEGHAGSTYMVRTGATLYRAGFEVYRLTYPDHGDTQDMNEAVFHFGMLDKIAEALHRVVGAIRTRPVIVVGFSMGGNLALNLACRGLPGLKGVFTVSPAFDFASALTVLEGSVFHTAFLKSWKRSLERKQQLFPDRYDFTDVHGAQTVGKLAGDLLALDGRPPSFGDYASRYAITPAKLAQLAAPTHVIASVDDPIVGPVPYEQYRDVPGLNLHIQRHGGHVGFLETLFGPAWYEGKLLSLIDEMFAPRAPVASTGAAQAALPGRPDDTTLK